MLGGSRFGSIALIVLGAVAPAHGQGNAPADQEIAAAIARGVAFLKESQSDEGHWDEPSQRQHQLGMTALAGLALLENGVARDAPEISQGPRASSPSWPGTRIKPTTSRWRFCSWRGASKGGEARPTR